MAPEIAANFVEARTGKVVKGFIRKATGLDLLRWATWHYRENDQDRDWDWSEFYALSQRAHSTAECYAAIAAGELHGLMLLDVKRSRLGLSVDYLASNPLRRDTIDRLKYVGTALIAVAILRSVESRNEGRIWLESLPGAESFYQGLQMSRRRRKSKDGYIIYAFDSEDAQQFLEQIKEKRILQL